MEVDNIMVVSRVVVNHVELGGTAPDARNWDNGSILKSRNNSLGVNIDLGTRPAPSLFWGASAWCTIVWYHGLPALAQGFFRHWHIWCFPSGITCHV